MGLRDALYVLNEAGLNVKTGGAGKVYSQSIVPGTKSVKGGRIEILLR